jgi:hypothetical protein
MFHPRSLFASCSIAGGCIWLLSPLVLSFPRLHQAVQYEYLLLIAPLFLLVGVIGFYRAYAPKYSFAGRGGLWLLGVGVLGFVPLGTHRTLFVYTLGTGFLLLIAAMIGTVLVELGAVGIAIDAWRTSTPSRWLAGWLPLALPATAATNYLGDTVLGIFPVGMHYYSGVSGLMWIGLGYFLWRSTDANQASRLDDETIQ